MNNNNNNKNNNLWSWITALPSSPLPLASSSGRSILLSADHNAATAVLTLSISLNGFHASNPNKILWVSEPIPLSATTPLLFLLQLLHEIMSPGLPKLDPARLLPALGPIHDTPNLLSLALLCRLFWLCAAESSPDSGFLFFRELDSAIEGALDCGRSLRAFLLAAGADREERFMRSVGYMLTKWCILRELSAATAMRRPPVGCCPAYAAELRCFKHTKIKRDVVQMWRKPAAGSVKINIVAFSGGSNSVISGVFRNDKGRFLLAFSYPLTIKSNNLAPLYAILISLDICGFLCIDKFVIEVNNRMILKWILGEVNPPFDAFTSVQDIKLKVSFKDIHFSLCPDVANGPAIALSVNHACGIATEITELPSNVQKMLWIDNISRFLG